MEEMEKDVGERHAWAWGLWLLLPVLALVGCGPVTPGVDDPSDGPDSGHIDDEDDEDGEDPPIGEPLPPEEPPTREITSIDAQLRELGMDLDGLEASGRMLADGVYASPDWGPLGPLARLAPKELVLAGIGSECHDHVPTTPDTEGLRIMTMDFHDKALEEPNLTDPVIECHAYETFNHLPSFGPEPNSSLTRPGSQSTRSVAIGDFDGDGLEEAVAYVARQDTAGLWQFRQSRIKQGSPATSVDHNIMWSVGNRPLHDLEFVGGDFDGTGRDHAVGVVVWGTKVLIKTFMNGGNPSTAQTEIDLAELNVQGTLSVSVAAGNLDLDPASELVVLVRGFEDGNVENGGVVHAFVYDNPAVPGGVFPLLSHEVLRWSDGDGVERNVLTAGVTIGDFDGDGVGEWAITGIGRFPANGDTCAPYTYVYRVYDDLPSGGGVLSTLVDAAPSHNCRYERGAGYIYEVFARTFNPDGHPRRALLANERVLRIGDEGALEVIRTVDNVIPRGDDSHVSEATVALTVGDLDGDYYDEVIAFHASINSVRVESTTYRVTKSIVGPTSRNPIIHTFDTDLDGTTLAYVPNSHRVVATEPIVHLVMAAPPYSLAYGQDAGGAVSSYGVSTSEGATEEMTVSFSVAASVGISAGFTLGPVDFSAEFTSAVEQQIEQTYGSTYTVTHTDTYETAGRDAVLFTSVPYDVYDYLVVASDDPAAEGTTLALMLPRTPYTRLVSREYFNARVPEGSLRIGPNVLAGTAGDPSSYLDRQGMNAHRGLLEQDNLSPPNYLQSAERTVGEGSTSTSVAISLAREDFYSKASSISWTHTVGLTAGSVMTEFTVGHGEGHAFTTTVGKETEVSGSVPSINLDDTHHPEAVYTFGMATYMQRLTTPSDPQGQIFQVINYWVDR